MRIDIISIFPDYLAPLQLSLIGKAQAKGLIDIRVHDLREWATDVHKTVDDTPYGGGAGMVMLPEIWGRALDSLLPSVEESPSDLSRNQGTSPLIIFTTPAGNLFSQNLASEWADEPWLIFCCGRYEGIDARVPEFYRKSGYRVAEVSIGDYVLNGGEVAALVMIEAITRLAPGVIGNPESLTEESHNPDGLLEYPSYTKPAYWRGLAVPEVLLSGHHAKIVEWRHRASQERTAQYRPELLSNRIEE
jgi:tRNA (guanine37-N1)-methyltransferase